ncbi:MAG: ATP-binding protein [Candidatus Hydrogenedentota bacterium]
MNEAPPGREAEELKHTVSLLRSTLDSTTDGILVVDLHGKITLFNQRFVDMWKIPRDIMDRRDDDAAIMHVMGQLEEPERFIAKILELYAKPDVESFDVLRFKDGRIFERYSISQKLDGVSVGRVWSFRDATERRRNEEALEESEKRFRQMADNLRHVFYFGLPDFSRILYVNPAYEQVWGRSCESLYAQPISWFDAVHADDKDQLKAVLDAHVGKGSSYALEYRIIRPDGSVRWIWDRIVELKNEEGKIYRAVGIAEDITDRKYAEVERLKLLQREKIARVDAEAAVRARDEFLAIASHELKTPIATLRIHLDGLLQAIRQNTLVTLPADRQQKMIDIAERQLDRLHRLVQLLLDVTRAGEGRLRIQKEKTDLAEVVRSSAERFEKQLNEAGSILKIDIVGPVTGQWDRSRLEQVVDNILLNAVKYGQGTAVSIRVREENGNAILEVSDKGRGIPMDQQKKIFEKYERGDLPQGFAGLGMGLYIAREIVIAHGGTIEIESQPGEGSLFRVVLPI